MRTFGLLLVLSLQEKAPDARAIADAEKQVQSLYKEEYSKKAPKDRAFLGQKLLEQARQSKEAPASQYVLYREAQDNLAQGGELTQSFDAIDEWGRRFVIDAVDWMAKAIAAAGKVAKTPEEALAIGGAHLKTADAAVMADRFDIAEKEAQAAVATAKKVSNVPMISRAMAKVKEMAEQKSAFDKLKKSRDALAANPDDPDASLAVGRYQCFAKGNWDAGLALLAKGSDTSLKELATKDLAAPKEPEAQLGLGDAWWELGEKSPAPEKATLRSHAVAWYDTALPKLQGLPRVRADHRATEFYLAQHFRGTWIDVDPKLLAGKGGETEPPPTGFHYKVLHETPPGSDYDAVSIRIKATGKEPSNIHLEVDLKMTQLVYLDQVQKTLYSTIKEGGSTRREKVVPIEPQEEFILTLVFQDGMMVVFLNGREKFRIATEYRSVKFVGYYRLSGSYSIDQLKLRKKN
jgi:hypothetical protein